MLKSKVDKKSLISSQMNVIYMKVKFGFGQAILAV
jgi:hypothetical protein